MVFRPSRWEASESREIFAQVCILWSYGYIYWDQADIRV